MQKSKIITGVLIALAVAGGVYFYTRKPVKKGGAGLDVFGAKFQADVKKRIEDAYKESGSKLPIEQWWAEANKAKGATLSAEGKPDITTIKGVGTAEGQSVTGYKLPDNLNAVPVPVTLFFSPNLTPEVFGKLGKKLDNKISKLVIVDRDAKLNGGSLISEEGYSVTFKPNSDLMVYQDADFNKKGDGGDGDDLGDDFGGGSGSGGGGGGGSFGSLDNGLIPMPFYPYPVPPTTPPTTNTNTVTIGGRTFERPTTTQTLGVNPNVLGGGSGSGGGLNVGTPPPIGVNPNIFTGSGNSQLPHAPLPRPLPRPRPAPPVGRPRPTGRPPMGRPIMPRPIGRRFDGGVENIDGSFEY